MHLAHRVLAKGFHQRAQRLLRPLERRQHDGDHGVRPEQFASRRTWATCIAETRPPISDTALARLQAVATFCGRWLKDLPERLEMQDRIEALGEEVKDLQALRRETFRRTRDLRSTADKLLETTLRNRDTPEFYSYY